LGGTIDIQYNNPEAIENARELKLSVLLEPDSFFYWATDEKNEVVRIEQVLGTDLTPLLEVKPASINVSFVHRTGYIVPASFHNNELLASMMHTTENISEWTSFPLEYPDAHLYLPKNDILEQPNSLGDKLKSFQPLAKYFLFPSFVEKELFEASVVHIHFMETLVYLGVYRGGKLLLWQSVSLASAYELQYFLLLIYDQFKMDRKEVPLLLSGRLSAGSQMYHLIYPYFAKIKWANFPEGPEYPKLPGTIPAHYLADLWLIHQCES
jgi:hypothetical protein